MRTTLIFSILAAIGAPRGNAYTHPEPVAVSVRQSGAKGDCVTDDTEALRAAILHATSLYLPTGCYRITGTLALLPGGTLRGDGEQHSYILYTGTEASNQAVIAAANGVRIEHLGIRSSASASPAIGIDTKGARKVLLDYVGVRNMRSVGVALNGSGNTLSNSIVDSNKFGVSASGDRQILSGNTISNHYSRSAEAAAPWNSATSLYWDGIVSEGLTNSLILSNTVEDNGQSGIYTGGNGSFSRGNRILHNLVRWNWNRGIDQGVTGAPSPANGVSEVEIAGNTLIDNRCGNLWLQSVDGATITGNTIRTTPAYPTFFRSQAIVPIISRPEVALATLTSVQSTAHVLLTRNKITASLLNANCVSLNMGSGEGNMIGNNTRNANCLVYLSQAIDLRKNALVEPGIASHAAYIGELTLSPMKAVDRFASSKVGAGSRCFFRPTSGLPTSTSSLNAQALAGSVRINHPGLDQIATLSIWCTQP